MAAKARESTDKDDMGNTGLGEWSDGLHDGVNYYDRCVYPPKAAHIDLSGVTVLHAMADKGEYDVDTDLSDKKNASPKVIEETCIPTSTLVAKMVPKII